jgi:hypothetical protein
VIGFFAGIYPAIVLSSFHPKKILSGGVKIHPKGSRFRQILVVTQFTLTIIMIAGTLVVYNQLDHLKKQHLGFNKENVICIPMRGNYRNKSEAIKEELLKNPGIIAVANTSSLPTHIGSGTSGAEWEGKPENLRVQMQLLSVDHDYLETFQMDMREGRFFSRDFPTDSKAFVLNESAIKAMNVRPKVIGRMFAVGPYQGPIIGVIRNFNYKSLHISIEPLIIMIQPRAYRHSCVRIKAENTAATIKHLERIWQKFIPDFPFKYEFLDQRLSALYNSEQKMGTVFSYFTFIAIFIACLGLFGLASFTAEQRTKEFGIRKVLGALPLDIFTLLSREFLKWILIANLLAIPLALITIRGWLKNFAYRTPIGVDIFIISTLLSFIIALVAITYESINAAKTNPVDTLSYE